MKAILLCAGRGSRLDPLTRNQPKCLVKVGGKTILDHQVAALSAAGITEIVVVGGYRISQLSAFIEAVRTPCRPRLIENPLWETTSSIGSVWAARALLEAPFCIMNGDTVFERTLVAHARGALKPGINLVVEYATPEPDDMRVAIGEGRITAIGKTLSPEQASARSLGLVMCPDDDGGPYRDALEVTFREPGGNQRYHHDIVDRIARSGAVHPVIMDGYAWQEIDRADDIAAWERRSLRDAA